MIKHYSARFVFAVFFALAELCTLTASEDGKPQSTTLEHDTQDKLSHDDKVRMGLTELGYVVVPLEQLKKTGHLIATATVNGKQELRLVCDTGSGLTLLTPNAVMSLGLAATESSHGGVKGLKIETTTLDTFKIGSYEQAKMNMLVVDIAQINVQLEALGEEPVDGIIGNDWMSQHKAILDVSRLRMFISNDLSSRHVITIIDEPPPIRGAVGLRLACHPVLDSNIAEVASKAKDDVVVDGKLVARWAMLTADSPKDDVVVRSAGRTKEILVLLRRFDIRTVDVEHARAGGVYLTLTLSSSRHSGKMLSSITRQEALSYTDKKQNRRLVLVIDDTVISIKRIVSQTASADPIELVLENENVAFLAALAINERIANLDTRTEHNKTAH